MVRIANHLSVPSSLLKLHKAQILVCGNKRSIILERLLEYMRPFNAMSNQPKSKIRQKCIRGLVVAELFKSFRYFAYPPHFCSGENV